MAVPEIKIKSLGELVEERANKRSLEPAFSALAPAARNIYSTRSSKDRKLQRSDI
jgi:hypothetical protein